MSTLTTTRVENSVGDGVDVAGLGKIDDTGKNICTAWVNFDGTTTPPTIRDSFNINSVSRDATGLYTISFSTNMDNQNYVFGGSSSNNGSTTGLVGIVANSPLGLSSIQIRSGNDSGTSVDKALINVYIHGGKN